MDKSVRQRHLISIIMATHSESADLLLKAILSIQKQTYSNLELIIVNDGNNNIDQALQSVSLPQLIVVNNEGVGLVDALNTGLARATGNFIARMDADDISLPDRLEKSLKFLEEFDLDFVATDINYIDLNNTITKFGNFRTLIGVELKNILKKTNIMNHPTWLIKKEVFLKNGGYLHFYKNEDWNFVLRAIDNGFKLGFLGEPLLNYRVGPNKITTSKGLYHSNFTFTNLKLNWVKGAIREYSPEKDDDSFALIKKNVIVKRERFISFIFRNVTQTKVSIKVENLLDYWTYVYCYNALITKIALRRIIKHDK